ncbi:hypothetical protein [Salimicrobium album]|uniref:Uncharacterized protein n=1 Tax=Salimicrobium album TaxID=50717 RepID=A0A1H3DEH9_9BACI|nr:hypothetical protein [Salimicrobium album]SDX64079.1 hypothetical protein SAMN04488081_0911 [Salimicrobium album]
MMDDHPISKETQQRIFEFFLRTSAPRLYEEDRKRKEGERESESTP